MTKLSILIEPESVAQRVLNIRGQRIMIDSDLADLYGVPTKVLNQAVRRNIERFPVDFMFQLNKAEKQEVVTNCDHLSKLKFSSTHDTSGSRQALNWFHCDRCRTRKSREMTLNARIRTVDRSNEKRLALRSRTVTSAENGQ